MSNGTCVFCGEPLDKSDEHIIPNCLNGRLHSTKIVCHSCNTKKFGENLDPAIKKLFNPLLLLCGFDNANGIHIEDPQGSKYLFGKKGEINSVKPELAEVKKNNKTYISVIGDKKNAVKYFDKHKEELLRKGYKSLKYEVSEITNEVPPLHFECKFEITQEIIIELNKIAVEFYAYMGLDLSFIKHLTEQVNILSKELNNVIFCNWNEEVRQIKSDEISHLIVIRTHDNGDVFCYIELFNVLCAYIKLYNNTNDKIDEFYHQDAITGERFNENIILNLDNEPPNENDSEDFAIQINAMFERIKSREFIKISTEIFTDIKTKVEQEVEVGVLPDEEFIPTYIKRCCESIAELSVYEFPYMIEECKDEENSELNYIHSNLQEGEFEDFCELIKPLIGVQIFQLEGIFTVDGFLKRPFLKRNGITLVKVYCVLIHIETKRKKYIPYRDFLEGLTPREEVHA